MTPSPFITMIICTRNRAAQLRQVLQSATEMDIPPDLLWEFIVVDNGSSDNTTDVVSSFSDRLPIRCVREDMAGLSNARNRGVAEAKGQYICWTDDDVEIGRGWLKAYFEAFKKYPDAALFGGKVLPRLEEPKTSWFERLMYQWPLENLIAYRDFGDKDIELSFDGWRVPWGANFAVKAEVQKKIKYDPDLGVSPNHKRLGEETMMMYQMFKQGATGQWVPGATVNHIIPRHRQTLKYLYQYSYLAGETFSFLKYTYGDDHYLVKDGVKPPYYELSKLRLYRRAIQRLIMYGFYALQGKDKKLGYLRDFGFYMGAASFERKQ